MVLIALIGIVCGLILSLFFSFGPGFWGLIQNSIHYGFRKGVAFEIGVNLSDIMMVVLALTLFNKDSISTVLRTPAASIIGGVVIIAFGLVSILRTPEMSTRNKGRIRVVLKKVPKSYELVSYGFALNSFNPSVWLYWAAMTAVVKAEVNFTDLQVFVFFISMLLAELAGGIIKCRLASMLKRVFSVRVLMVVNRVMGCILVGLGIYLIVSMAVRLKHPERPEKEPTEVVTQIIHQSLHGRDSINDGDTFYLK